MRYFLLGFSALLLFFGTDAWACSCVTGGPTPCQVFSQSSVIFVGTVLDIENPPRDEPELDDTGLSRYRFHVDEWIAGPGGAEVDVYSDRGGADCSFHFKQGEQYLVSPYNNEEHRRLYATVCSDTRHVSQVNALLPQLRALRDGRGVASIYGILRKTQQPYAAVYQGGYDQTLANTPVQLRSRRRHFETSTDDKGVFAFYGVPAGTYTWSATLPTGLELAQTILSDPLPPIEVPASVCYEYDLEALPTGRIRGRVLGPDGKPVRSAFVDLFRVERYKDRESFGTSQRWWEYQEKEGFFEFLHVAPGEYILVFNSDNKLDPDALFARTFYPSARDLATAQRIVVREGEQFLGADIHVSRESSAQAPKLHKRKANRQQ